MIRPTCLRAQALRRVDFSEFSFDTPQRGAAEGILKRDDVLSVNRIKT